MKAPERASVSRDDFLEAGPQGQLFPNPRRGVLIFLHFPDVTEREFRETIECAKPSFVLELRSVPRFDFGRLNRRSAFKVFQNEGSDYLDLTSSLMGRTDTEAVLANLQEFLTSKRPSFERPVVFLFNSTEADNQFVRRVIETVTSFNSEACELYEVPRSLQG